MGVHVKGVCMRGCMCVCVSECSSTLHMYVYE